jgi:hypothetical protein
VQITGDQGRGHAIQRTAELSASRSPRDLGGGRVLDERAQLGQRLVLELAAARPELRVVVAGGALAPRTLLEAVAEGAQAGALG